VSARVSGVLFVAYPQDHEPRHIHGFYGEVEVIVDLLPDRMVSLADRPDSIRPSNAKRNSVRHVLNSAAENYDELVRLWVEMHG